MLYSFFFIINVIISIALIAIVLMHRGKGSEVGAAFSGATSSLSLFGAKGPDSFLIKIVSVLAFLFFLNALAMIYVAGHDFADDSVIDQFGAEETVIHPDFERGEGAPVGADGGWENLQGTDGDVPTQEDGKRNVVPEVPD